MVGVGIFGWGSHGRDIATIFFRTAYASLARFDEDPAKGFRSVPDVPCYVGINWSKERKAVVERLRIEAPRALVDPSAIVDPGCRLQKGVVVAPNAVLLRDVELGEHVHVNFCASMTRCKIGSFSTIAPGATICGDVTIGEEVFVGCGAIIKDRITVGDGATIGAGAVVVRDVPAGATVMGVPAR